MKMIQVPEDVNEITDLAQFKQTIIEVNKFNENLTKFGNKILEKWIKPIEEWHKILSKEDWKKATKYKVIYQKKQGFPFNRKEESYIFEIDLKKDSENEYIFDYKNKKLIPFITYHRGWTMGASTAKESTIKFSDCGNVLTITVTWQSQKARFEWEPWITHEEIFHIDYINELVLDKPY